MKRFRVVFIVILLLSVTNIYAVDRSEVWSILYRRSETMEQKYSIMLRISELNDPGLVDLLDDILIKDIVANLNNSKNTNTEKAYVELSKLVVRNLGKYKAKESASYVYQVYLGHKDALLKSEAIMALGNMHATEYIDDIAYILHLKNNRPRKGAYSSNDLDHENRVAFAAISALDRFKDAKGYESVFIASQGWYHDRVTNYANKVLLTITEDPTDSLISIINKDDFINKEKAIKEVLRCNAPSNRKNTAALVSLEEGHKHVPGNVREGVVLTSIRKYSIYTLWDNKSSNSSDVPFLVRSLTYGSDLEEKILAIKALGVNKSDDAIESLISKLESFNYKNILGMDISYLDEDVIRELILTLGNTKDKRAEIVLYEVLYSDYTDGIQRVAEKALEQLG